MSFSPRERRAFLDAYIECALWSLTDKVGKLLQNAGKLLQDAYLAESTHADMRVDCEDFLDSLLHIDLTLSETTNDRATLAALLDEAIAKHRYSIERAGHDFWLTRNYRGTGFWDRDLSALGDALTKWAHTAGKRDLYLGDDNQVYQG